MKITVKQKNVHSKALFTAIDDHVRSSLALLTTLTDVDAVVSLLEMMIDDEAKTHKLEQVNIIGDARNNKFEDIKNGKYVIDIYYKHMNCYNVTELSYRFDFLG